MADFWVAAAVPESASELERGASGISPRLAQLLALRGIESAAAAQAFLNPDRSQLHDPRLLPDFELVLGRLAAAGKAGELVTIVGDYDVDGVTATALFASGLRAIGARVHTILPRRDAEGYGLQPIHVQRAAEEGARLLVAVDSGTLAHEAAAEAVRQQVELIVVDHHLPGDTLPGGALLVNPRRLDSRYPFAELTAAGLSAKLVAALLEACGHTVPWEALLRVAALGTIADVAPLLGENRVLAALGVAVLAASPSPGLQALLKLSGVRKAGASSEAVTATDVGFRLAPRLNAAGRLGSPEPALELLLTRDPVRAMALAQELHRLNAERQRIELSLLQEARDDLARRGADPAIVVAWRPGWHRGVLGIAAARLARETHRPVLLLGVEGGRAVGSGRSAAGIELHEFLQPWQSRLERFGGHAQAIGLTVQAAALEGLRSEWEQAAESWRARITARSTRYDIELGLDELEDGLVAELRCLEPHGPGNEQPVFRFSGLRSVGAAREFGAGHLAFEVTTARSSSARRRLVAWRWAERRQAVPGQFDLLAAVERGLNGSAELRLIDIRPAGAQANE